MNHQSIKHSESGRTMLEMLGVLGIMGIIMYGAIAGINYGMSTYKINQTYNEVQEAIQGIQDLYSWGRDYPTAQPDLTGKMCENDIFTNCDGGEPKNPFGGDITVFSKDAGKTFVVTYKSIDDASCNRLNEMDWGPIVMDADCSTASTVDVAFCPRNEKDQSECP